MRSLTSPLSRLGLLFHDIALIQVSLQWLLCKYYFPSISSANYDEYSNLDTAKMIANMYSNFNTHLRYANLHDHGYALLTIKKERATSEFFYVKSVKEPNSALELGKRVWVNSGEPFVRSFGLYEQN